MDYSQQPLRFKLRKAGRYVRLYGARRTWVKAASYRHMNRTYATLPPQGAVDDGRHVGIIGCGKYAYAQVAYYLRKLHGDVLRGSMDVDIQRAASLSETYGGFYTDDAGEIVADPGIDTVFVASNHASHAEYAIAALEAGKATHIEKPHVVSAEQLQRLCTAIERHDGRAVLGFNRPLSPFGVDIAEALAQQRGPMMLNWFVAGHEIEPDHWYFSREEGGRVLGNLCHWTDFVYQLVDEESRYPIQIRPTRAEKADSDLAVTFMFGDGSIAAITFSAKGHTFEGVKERFAAHRGNLLLTMDDFKTLELQVGAQRRRRTLRRRDHGHARLVERAYRLGQGAADPDPASYIWETGELFLKTREALEALEDRVVEPYARAAVDVAART